MSAEILASILSGENAAAAKKVITRLLSDDAVTASMAVLTNYDLARALDAIATMHHAEAVKNVKAVIDALSEAIEAPRRTMLDGALAAVLPYISAAQGERLTSKRFEAAAFAVGKQHECAELFDAVVATQKEKEKAGLSKVVWDAIADESRRTLDYGTCRCGNDLSKDKSGDLFCEICDR